MAQSKKKTVNKPLPKESSADPLESKTANPLVFISHDTEMHYWPRNSVASSITPAQEL
jgi:hypothetical protein